MSLRRHCISNNENERLDNGASTGSSLNEPGKLGGSVAASAPSSKRARAELSTPIRNRKLRPLELLMSAPVDIFAEIFSHLRLSDLLALAKTARVFRSLLLGRAGRALWSRSRINEGYPDPALSNVSELGFATFLHATCCQECHRSGPFLTITKWWGLRAVLCRDCEKIVFIAKSRIRGDHPHIHKFVFACVPTVEVRGGNCCLRSDLEQASQTLCELQEEDEHETERRQLLRHRQSGTTRSRRTAKITPGEEKFLEAPHTERVSKFVAERVVKVAALRSSGTSFSISITRMRNEDVLAALDMLRAFVAPLQNITGGTYLTFEQIIACSSVVKFWEPDDLSPLNQATWNASLPLLVTEIATLREEQRVGAIRSILAANDPHRDISQYSADSTTYVDQVLFGPTFFQHITSTFLFVNRAVNPVVGRFPEVRETMAKNGMADVDLREGTSKEMVKLLKLLLKVAGLNEATATIEALDEIGTRFLCTSYRVRGVNWKELASHHSPCVQWHRSSSLLQIRYILRWTPDEATLASITLIE